MTTQDKIKEVEKMKNAIESLDDEELEEVNKLVFEALKIK